MTRTGDVVDTTTLRSKFRSDLPNPRFVSPNNDPNNGGSTQDNTPVPEVSPQKAIKNSLEPHKEVPVHMDYSTIMM